MARRKTTATTAARKPAARRTTASTATRTKRKRNSKLANFLVPLFLICCLVFAIGFLLLAGIRTASASSFFELETITIKGTHRASNQDIEAIVRRASDGKGVWNTDITQVRNEIEGLRFVRRASVSRVLPDKLRIVVDERVPVAIVRLDGQDYWVDDNAVILSRIGQTAARTTFTMFGWDLQRTSEATARNKKRLLIYLQLREEFKENELATRVQAVDLTDPDEPRAIIADSGKPVTIVLGLEDHADALRKGIESAVGRGNEIETVIVASERPVIEYRNS